MAAKSEKPTTHTPKTVRASVSFPRELYESLEQIAQEKKVSVAWVVRDAVEKYVAEKWPLFEREARP
ncbi:MAG: ribbon-helix-helix protein, CopG family [Candidatus Competibacteraceae bacterium]|nr:ribbon-helix-helix protein, CopG family [Candidatus Competibacteraceae bacterium]